MTSERYSLRTENTRVLEVVNTSEHKYSDGMTEDPTFAQVIAENVRRLRGEHTMDAVASEARHLGVKWASGNIATIEKGKVRPTLQNLLILTYALGRVNRRQIRPTELLLTEQDIDPGFPTLRTTAHDLTHWWNTGDDALHLTQKAAAEFHRSITENLAEKLAQAGEQFDRMPADLQAGWDEVERRITTGDERIARSAGIAPRMFRLWSEHLWGRGFEDERDERAGEGASAQKKGRISRGMKAEIREKIDGAPDSDDDPR